MGPNDVAADNVLMKTDVYRRTGALISGTVTDLLQNAIAEVKDKCGEFYQNLHILEREAKALQPPDPRKLNRVYSGSKRILDICEAIKAVVHQRDYFQQSIMERIANIAEYFYVHPDEGEKHIRNILHDACSVTDEVIHAGINAELEQALKILRSLQSPMPDYIQLFEPIPLASIHMQLVNRSLDINAKHNLDKSIPELWEVAKRSLATMLTNLYSQLEAAMHIVHKFDAELTPKLTAIHEESEQAHQRTESAEFAALKLLVHNAYYNIKYQVEHYVASVPVIDAVKIRFVRQRTIWSITQMYMNFAHEINEIGRKLFADIFAENLRLTSLDVDLKLIQQKEAAALQTRDSRPTSASAASETGGHRMSSGSSIGDRSSGRYSTASGSSVASSSRPPSLV